MTTVHEDDVAPGKTRARDALDRIMALMRSGELRPGSIINEVELARRFEMSRGPVREAVKHLEARQIIEREAYQRARLTPLNRDQITAIFQLRECLEGMACRLATLNMSDDQMRELCDMVEATENPSVYGRVFNREFKFEFHKAVVARCGNSRIGNLLNVEVYELVRLYRWIAGTSPGRDGKANTEHWQIVRAMRARDADLAESLMRAHIQRSMRYLAD